MSSVPGAQEFPEAAVEALAFLRERGFRVTARERAWVRFESADVVITAGVSPRGEVEIAVARLGDESGSGRLTLGGQVGTASAARIIELLAEKLRFEEAALRGDESYFRALAEDQAWRSKELTDWAMGHGPQPSQDKLA